MYSVKKIIFITRKRKLYDIPDNIRKIHGEQIPSLGGVGIFIGFITTAPLFFSNNNTGWNFIIISIAILFFTGVYDDIMNMRPSKKLLAQLIASGITVYFADIRISYFPGPVLIPYGVSILLTTLCCTFFINVFNFIDGIDGLAGLLSILYTACFGCLFAYRGYESGAAIAFCLTGATLGLLYYNYPPAKIYMGDTGSMLCGFIVFLLAVMFLQKTPGSSRDWIPGAYYYDSAPFGIIISILYLPVFDAIRVFILRASKGISPLKADRRHLHYYLLDAGLSHAQAAWLLVGVNIFTILIACLLQHTALYILYGCISIPSIIITIMAAKMRRK